MFDSYNDLIWGGAFLFVASIAYYHVVHALKEIHLSLNSRLDELLSVTKSLAIAEGYIAGQENEKKRFEEIEKVSRALEKPNEPE